MELDLEKEGVANFGENDMYGNKSYDENNSYANQDNSY